MPAEVDDEAGAALSGGDGAAPAPGPDEHPAGSTTNEAVTNEAVTNDGAEPAEGPSDTPAPEAHRIRSFSQWLTEAEDDELPPLVWMVLTAVLAVVFVAVYLFDQDVPSANKVRTAAVVSVALFVGFLGISFYGRSRSTKVASVVDGVALALAVGVIGILPALVLGGRDQLLLLKLGSIAALSMLPGLIYLQFLAARGEAVWDEFTETLRRLDVRSLGEVPARGEIPDARNLYRRKFEATYGRLDATSGSHRSRGRVLFPVFVLSALVTVGWVVTLQPEVVGSAELFTPFEPTGDPGLSATALHFGFVGSYYFVLQMLLRRYFQNDLKADAYWSCVLRVVTTALLSATIAAVFPDLANRELAATAFLIGVFPQFGVDLIRTGLVFPAQAVIKRHQARYPLSELDGMNIWYESRLLEEGVEDLQNLKTVSWVDLLLRTRIPPGRLVDWVDQSHLLLHVLGPPARKRSARGSADRERLRSFGIRTATDLEAAFYAARAEGDTGIQSALDGDAPQGEPERATHRVTSIVRVLAAQPVLRNVRAWKDQVDPPNAVGQSLLLPTDRRIRLDLPAGRGAGPGAQPVPPPEP